MCCDGFMTFLICVKMELICPDFGLLDGCGECLVSREWGTIPRIVQNSVEV